MNAALKTYRHGDLVIRAVEKRPTRGLKIIRGGSLARGTATGHSHALTDPKAAKLYEVAAGKTLLVVARKVGIKHEEHKTISLAPGQYEVTHKRQYDAVLGQRPVED